MHPLAPSASSHSACASALCAVPAYVKPSLPTTTHVSIQPQAVKHDPGYEESKQSLPKTRIKFEMSTLKSCHSQLTDGEKYKIFGIISLLKRDSFRGKWDAMRLVSMTHFFLAWCVFWKQGDGFICLNDALKLGYFIKAEGFMDIVFPILAIKTYLKKFMESYLKLSGKQLEDFKKGVIPDETKKKKMCFCG